MGARRKRVALVVREFPEDASDPSGIFNYRLALSLSLMVSLSVIKVGYWRPGRPIFRLSNGPSFSVCQINCPYVPAFWPLRKWSFGYLLSDITMVMAAKVVFFFIKRRKLDIVHSVSLGSITLFADRLAAQCSALHVVQLIGSDVNVELPKRTLRFSFGKACHRVTAWLANSRDLRRRFLTFFPEAEVAVRYRGADLTVFSGSAPKPKCASTPMVFLFLGGAPGRTPDSKNKKGALTLLRAWKLAGHSGSSAKLLMGGVGATSENIGDTAEGLENVEFLGRVDVEDVPALLQVADIVVIPSRNEGLPNVGMEAFASGRPVIGFSVGGMPELIDHDVNGWLLEDFGEVALSEAISDALQDPLKCIRLGVGARQKAEAKFDSAQYGSRIVELYCKLLSAEAREWSHHL